MILKISNNKIVNWDNVTAIVTNNLNMYHGYLLNTDYVITRHKGDEGYTDYPFVIQVQFKHEYDNINIFRTSDAEEMQEMYDAILARIVTDLSNKKSLCDISDLTKTHDLWNKYIDFTEYKEKEENERKEWFEMQEVRADG